MQKQLTTLNTMLPIAKICQAITLGTNFAVACNSQTEPKLLREVYEDSQDKLNALIEGEELELQNDILDAYSQALLAKDNLMKFKMATPIGIKCEMYIDALKAKYTG